MRVAIIAAVARNGVIGADQAMPWRLATDLKRFKSLTIGHPVVMGRKTFEAIGKALPGRLNVVVTRGAIPDADVVVAPDLAAALAVASNHTSVDGEVFVIGGGQIYAAAMPLADRLYITHVEAEPAGDTHFPTIEAAEWTVVSEEKVPRGERDSAETTYVIYERRRPDTIG